MAEIQGGETQLPPTLAILPIQNKVLLPGAVVRLQFHTPASVRFVEQELRQKEDKWRFIGVLPIRDRQALEQPSSPGGSAMSSSFTQGSVTGDRDGGSVNPSDLQMVGNKQSNDVVQWHPRFILEVMISTLSHPLYCVLVTQPDYVTTKFGWFYCLEF